jgi:hypothetical protein
MQTDAINILHDPPNREAKRLVFFEVKKAYDLLNPIAVTFQREIFNSKLGSYWDIYRNYAIKWHYACEFLLNNNKFNHISIDSNWFKDQFHPKENHHVEANK